jgi:glucose/arabinose dehydrogenase
LVVVSACSSDDTGTDTGTAVSSAAPDDTTPDDTTPDDTTSDDTTPDDTTPDDTTPDDTTPDDTTPDDTDPPATGPAVRPQVGVGDAALTLEEPVDIAVRSGDDRLYVVERPGRITRIDDDTLDDTLDDTVIDVVLDISDQTENGGEQGLLGLAFSPDGAQAYVNFTDNDGDTVIAEFAVADDGTFAADSQREVLTIAQPFPNHNGGDLAFGPDGMLYIGTGDGGAADDPNRASLDLGDLLGKVLRIDPAPDGDQGYTVPGDNPFVGVDGARPEIWSIGVRNPWRFSFDPVTGDLWIADVGQNVWEEITRLPAVDGVDAGRGVSLGWSAFEGDQRFNDDQPDTDPAGNPHLGPLHVYEHGDDGCSISGGEVYRGDTIAGLDGWYVFGDFCSGKVWALELLVDGTAGEVREIGNVPQLVAVVAAPDGELWVLSLGGGIHPVVPA